MHIHEIKPYVNRILPVVECKERQYGEWWFLFEVPDTSGDHLFSITVRKFPRTKLRDGLEAIYQAIQNHLIQLYAHLSTPAIEEITNDRSPS